jgi:phospholipase A1
MRSLACLPFLLTPLLLHAQDAPAWQSCTTVTERGARLACFDRWAAQQAAPPAQAQLPAGEPPPAAPNEPRGLRLTEMERCHDPQRTALSRLWELSPDASCGTFGLRGYRPISASVVTANTVNDQPTSGNPLNNATSSVDYRTTETRLQLSVRTKLAQGLLTRGSKERSDSLWFAYTQQSYWQLFSPSLSRPFRSTDHEPEVVYVLPLQTEDKDAWRLRFAGLGVVHQSNGQSLPYSRSWNRVYLMAGAEKGPLQVEARVWRRLPEVAADDDNPSIGAYVGRAEARVAWQANRDNLVAATVRHSLSKDARGSVRLEWFRTLWDDGVGPPGGLQLHTQLFSGYGDSLLDYNRRRHVFSIGLSLVEW